MKKFLMLTVSIIGFFVLLSGGSVTSVSATNYFFNQQQSFFNQQQSFFNQQQSFYNQQQSFYNSYYSYPSNYYNFYKAGANENRLPYAKLDISPYEAGDNPYTPSPTSAPD